MKNLANGISLTLLSLIIAGLGVISPIAWDWWNKRTQITIEKKSSISIVSVAQPVKNLELFYNDKKVSELHKIVFVIRNSGKIPVTKDDVVSPIKLTFSSDEILEAVITRKEPKNLGALVLPSKNMLQFNFDLFNPGDESEIEILTAGKYNGFDVDARIKNITNIEIVDSTAEKQSWKNLGIGSYISGVFGILFIFVGIALLMDIPRKKMAISLLKEGVSRILKAKSPENAIDYINSDFGFLSGRRMTSTKEKIFELSFPLNEIDKQVLSEKLILAVDNENSLGGAIIAFIIGGIACWYVLSKLMIL